MKAASPFSFPASPALAAKLAKLGLASDTDLVLHLPLRWEDETRLTPIRDLLPGQTAQVQAVVREASVAYRPRRMLTVTVADAGGVLGIRFLNFYPSHLKLFQPGESFRFSGEVRGGFLGLEMVHPRFVESRRCHAAADPAHSGVSHHRRTRTGHATQAGRARAGGADHRHPARRLADRTGFAGTGNQHPPAAPAAAGLHAGRS